MSEEMMTSATPVGTPEALRPGPRPDMGRLSEEHGGEIARDTMRRWYKRSVLEGLGYFNLMADVDRAQAGVHGANLGVLETQSILRDAEQQLQVAETVSIAVAIGSGQIDGRSEDLRKRQMADALNQSSDYQDALRSRNAALDVAERARIDLRAQEDALRVGMKKLDAAIAAMNLLANT